MAKRTIVVFGATGAQGGGLARALLKDGEFDVRGVTRNPDSEKAKALKDLGAEVVKADIDDVKSLEAAMKGAYGAFFVTNFWEHMDVEKEIQQCKNLADAGKAAGIQHVVNSTLEDTREFVKNDSIPFLEGGKYRVAHFDGKGEGAKYIANKVPTTQLYTSFYYENFINFGMGPKKGQDGKLCITFPIGQTAMLMQAAKDIGAYAMVLFKDPSNIGKSAGCYGEALTGIAIAEMFSIILGKEVGYNAVPPAVYAGFGFPGAAELANMFQFFDEYDKVFAGLRKKIDGFQSFSEYLNENKAAFSDV